MKRCRQCGATKEFEFFSRNQKNKDGYRYFCKVCEKANAQNYYKENKETVISTILKWRAGHVKDVQRHKRRYYKKIKKLEETKPQIPLDNSQNPG